MRKYRLYLILVLSTLLQAVLEQRFGLFVQVGFCLIEGLRIWACGYVGARRLGRLMAHCNWLQGNQAPNELRRPPRGWPHPDSLIAHLGEKSASWAELAHIWVRYR